MAIVVFGTPCPLCGGSIEEGQEVVMFPPFIENEIDPLWLFNDAVFHENCFCCHSLAAQAEARYAEMKQKLQSGPKICAVCGDVISNPDDYFVIGYLTADRTHPLYQYNYTQFHRSHLPRWLPLPLVYEQLRELQRLGVWKGRALEWWLSEVRKALIVQPKPVRFPDESATARAGVDGQKP